MSKGQKQLLQAAIEARRQHTARNAPPVPVIDEAPAEIEAVEAPVQPSEEIVAGPITEKRTAPVTRRPVAGPLLEQPTPQEVDRVMPPFTPRYKNPEQGIDFTKTELPEILKTAFSKVKVSPTRIIVSGYIHDCRLCNASVEPIPRCIVRLAIKAGVSVFAEYANADDRYRIIPQ
jgi:hypothetical protein